MLLVNVVSVESVVNLAKMVCKDVKADAVFPDHVARWVTLVKMELWAPPEKLVTLDSMVNQENKDPKVSKVFPVFKV